MTDLEKVLQHAQLAHFDNELTSFVILMVTKEGPELHMAIAPQDRYSMNATLDMFKIELLKVMQDGVEERKQRE